MLYDIQWPFCCLTLTGPFLNKTEFHLVGIETKNIPRLIPNLRLFWYDVTPQSPSSQSGIFYVGGLKKCLFDKFI